MKYSFVCLIVVFIIGICVSIPTKRANGCGYDVCSIDWL